VGDSPAKVFEVFVVSDGTGDTGAAAVRAAMAQFQNPWRLRVFGDIRHASEVHRVITLAAESNALVVFSLVDGNAVRALLEEAALQAVQAVDLLGPLITRVAQVLRTEPRHQPGLLHGFSDQSFARAAAVEFAVNHDDGANIHTLFEADLVLVGVSRTSKTPLSMYLAQRGYKTGNVPLVPGVEPPQALLDLDSRKVFGLYVAPDFLLTVRQARLRVIGSGPVQNYADADAVSAEIARSRRLFRAQHWRSIDMSGRAVEEAASRILEFYEQDPPGR